MSGRVPCVFSSSRVPMMQPGKAVSAEQKLRSNVSSSINSSILSGNSCSSSQPLRSSVTRLVKSPRVSGSFVSFEHPLRLRCCSFPRPVKPASGISARDAHPLRSRRSRSVMVPMFSGSDVSTGFSGSVPMGVRPPHLLRLRCRRLSRCSNSESIAPETFMVQLSTSSTCSPFPSGNTSGLGNSLSSSLAMRSCAQGLPIVRALSTSSLVQTRCLSPIGLGLFLISKRPPSFSVSLASILRPRLRIWSCISSTSSLPSGVDASRLRVFNRVKPDAAIPTPAQYAFAASAGQPLRKQAISRKRSRSSKLSSW
mmetsp:Transcript_2611/g.7768  ORF Transcript_2611/g.7768 Transcript_2611/m.7768 type:complete len:311 (+) Transcript_2611:323-1255(+)